MNEFRFQEVTYIEILGHIIPSLLNCELMMNLSNRRHTLKRYITAPKTIGAAGLNFLY